MSEERTPGGLVLPTEALVEQITPQQTHEAINKIALGRNAQAAVALRELALAVVGAVNTVDKRYGVHDFLVNLKITCRGPGLFQLDIVDKNSDVNPQDVVDDVAEILDREKGDYHKQARAIQMEFTNERAEGPDGVAPGEVPAACEGIRST